MAPMVRLALAFVPSSVSTSLTVFGHSYLAAVLENGTNRALGKASSANVLPEGNEKPVYLNTVLAGQVLLQLPPRRVGRRRTHVAPPVRYAMNVDIDAYLARATRDSQSEIGALRPNSAKRRHDFEITRELPAILFDNPSGDLSYVACLGLVETRWSNQGSDLCDTHPADCFSGRGRLEQANCSGKRNFVSRPYGYDACDQLMKRGGVPLSGEIEHRGIRKLLNFQPDATQHGVDVERALYGPTIPTHFRRLVQGVVQTIVAYWHPLRPRGLS
jgi:hypothetical protein